MGHLKRNRSTLFCHISSYLQLKIVWLSTYFETTFVLIYSNMVSQISVYRFILHSYYLFLLSFEFQLFTFVIVHFLVFFKHARPIEIIFSYFVFFNIYDTNTLYYVFILNSWAMYSSIFLFGQCGPWGTF